MNGTKTREATLRVNPSLSLAIRSAAWFFALTYLACFIAVLFVVDDSATRANLTGFLLVVPLVAAVMASYNAMRASSGKRYRLWRLMTIAMGLFLTAELTRAITVWNTGHFPLPGSLDDITFALGFAALLPVALLATEPFEVVATRKLRNSLDLATILLAVYGFAAAGLFGPLGLLSVENRLVVNLFYTLYPTLSISLALYVMTFKRSRWRSSDVLFVAALVCGSIGVLLATTALSRGFYNPGTYPQGIADAALAATFTLFALTAIHALTRRESVGIEPNPDMDLPHWPGAAATIAALLGIPLLMWSAPDIADDLVRAVVSLSAALLAITVVLRSALVSYENRRLAAQATVDPLTGLLNQRSFKDRIAAELAASQRLGSDLSVCVFDIDDMDRFNSARGYRQGDDRLQSFAAILRYASGQDFPAFRIGADDFALLMPGQNAMEAEESCLLIAAAVRQSTREELAGMTLSVGIASSPLHTHDAEDLGRYAIGSAYWAESLGGDRIVMFDPAVVSAFDGRELKESIEAESQSRLIEALAAAVDARDPYTRYHSMNVADLSCSLGRACGLTDERVEKLHSAALLHDIGKIGVPDAILRKPAPLTDEEFAVIREHPALGVKIIGGAIDAEMLSWIESHHERWDGAGYPNGLATESIPFEARILTLCDAYDAMTSDRPYRSASSITEAIDELRRCAGTQFDPELMPAFEDVLLRRWSETVQ